MRPWLVLLSVWPMTGCDLDLDLAEPDHVEASPDGTPWSGPGTIVENPSGTGDGAPESDCAHDAEPSYVRVEGGALEGRQLPAVPGDGVDLASWRDRPATLRGRFHLEPRPVVCTEPGPTWRCMDGHVYCQWIELEAVTDRGDEGT